MGLFKDIIGYFSDGSRKRKTRDWDDSEDFLLPEPRNLADYIPIRDAHGRIEEFIRRDTRFMTGKPNTKAPMDNKPPEADSVQAERKIAGTGKSKPLPPLPNETITPVVLVPAPKNAASRASNRSEILSDEFWDGWPDGPMVNDFTYAEFWDSSKLLQHWATKCGGGDKKGDEHSDTWEGGKRGKKDCLGIMRCDNPTCKVIIRPATRADSIAFQLSESCICGAQILRQKCTVRSTAWRWAEGVHFENSGYHTHLRPTHILHVTAGEQRRFEALVNAHPNVGPLQLQVGVPGVLGPGESVTGVSDVYLNAHRVAKDRLKVKHGDTQGGDALISAFTDFSKKFPGFVIDSILGEETVISVQSNFMRSQLVKNRKLEGPINGTVNDAAHGYWKNRKSVLIVTSTYCSVLLCWVPGVISFSNGVSAAHFAQHFLCVFRSIEKEAELQLLTVSDELFAGVMDFSEAERSGFIQAFIEFWSTHKDETRSSEDLAIAAKHILKGCLQHFEAAVTRVSKINAVIPPHMVSEFQKRAKSLVKLPNAKAFTEAAALLVRDFPKLASWMEWWTRPSHASMLFESQRVMDMEVWTSLPDTTNAEEAMHWKLYRMCGRDHLFLEGMYALHGVAAHFEQRYDAASRKCLAY